MRHSRTEAVFVSKCTTYIPEPLGTVSAQRSFGESVIGGAAGVDDCVAGIVGIATPLIAPPPVVALRTSACVTLPSVSSARTPTRASVGAAFGDTGSGAMTPPATVKKNLFEFGEKFTVAVVDVPITVSVRPRPTA